MYGTPMSLREDARVRRLALLATVAVLAACGDGDTSATTARHTTTTPGPTRTASVLVYFLRDGKVAAARRTVTHTGDVEAAAIRALLARPTAAEAKAGLATGLPNEARLGSLAIANGSARIELVQPPADEDEPSGRWGVAQVVYTLTQFPRVEGVVFEGTRVLGKGLTRADLEDLTPAILVESPTVGQAVESPIRVTGTANTFEANFIVRLEADGKKLAEHFVTATSGNGVRGSFDTTIAAPPGTKGPVTLVVFEQSAADGSAKNVVRIPLRLQPQ
jgi:Immunoglobulin-like domain of bacterial spore germination/Sporulation and spore germination